MSCARCSGARHLEPHTTSWLWGGAAVGSSILIIECAEEIAFRCGASAHGQGLGFSDLDVPCFHSGNAYQSTWVKLEFRLAMPAGNSSAWNMASRQMGPLALRPVRSTMTTPSPPSSVRLAMASMCPGLSWSTWSLR